MRVSGHPVLSCLVLHRRLFLSSIRTRLEHDGLHHVVHDEHEVGVPDPVRHVLLPPREHVVDHDHLVALGVWCATRRNKGQAKSLNQLSPQPRPRSSNPTPTTTQTHPPTCSIRRSTRCDPTKPAPPVTSTRMRSRSASVLAGGNFCGVCMN